MACIIILISVRPVSAVSGAGRVYSAFLKSLPLKGAPRDWSIRRLISWRRATREDRDAIRPQCRAAHTIEEKGLLRPGGPASRPALLLSL